MAISKRSHTLFALAPTAGPWPADLGWDERHPAATDPAPTVALLAHDHEKVRLVDLAVCYRDVLARHRLIATATTGRMLTEMVGLAVDCLRPGMAGGDRQVAQAVTGRSVAAVIFLVDPFSSRPHEPSLGPVMKACSLHDIPLATNISTAGAVLHALAVTELQRANWSSLHEK